MNKQRPSQRELRTQMILRSDRTMLKFAASVLKVISNAVAILWLVLTFIAVRNGGEAQILLFAVAIPVLLFWLLGLYATRIVTWMTKDYPK
jgi:hypothetical protein